MEDPTTLQDEERAGESLTSPRILSPENDPICVVGMACHLPGNIRSPSDLWDFLIKKKSAQGTVPQDRFDGAAFFHDPDGNDDELDAGTEGGYFLEEDVRRFDNTFFGINNLEATHDQVSGSNTGVYVGNFTHDFFAMRTKDPDDLQRYDATGMGVTLLSNRISHVFNLHGPSVMLDTACSSSLYSLHVAVAALRAGECDSAIAAGVNLILTPETQVAARKAGILSSDSTCKTFDATANGYGRAEGVNAVYLKRLSSAIRDQDEIFSVIRGTALNSNGRTTGIALPSANMQEAVIRKAYQDARISLSGTDYIECHGTGTAVGDPLEVEALGRCFRSEAHQVLIGSVKPNLGHSEAASGLTSFIKASLACKYGLIPPTRGVSTLNPQLGLGNMNIRVVTEVESWPRNLRRAGLSAFGYGGANAHCIIESVDSFFGSPTPQSLPWVPTGQFVVLPVSAASKHSLETRKTQMSQAIESSDAGSLGHIAHTLIQRRSHLEHRDFVLATPRSTGTCEVFSPDGMYQQRPAHGNGPKPLAFVFTGQGAQYPGMAKELLSSQEVFRSTILQLDSVLQSLPSEHRPDWTLEQAILAPSNSTQVNQATHSQPLCTAIQIALIELLRDWGLGPSVVVGHSSGEIAASYAAGIHSASQAIIVAYYRGVAANLVPVGGAMLATNLDQGDALQLIARMGLADDVCIACVNSPESITLSGPREAILSVLEDLQSRSQFARLLSTGGKAYHSASMHQVGEFYEGLIRPHLAVESKGRVVKAEMQSSVGVHDSDISILEGSVDMAKYWRDNLEKPVQFSAAVKQILTRKDHHLVEIGPHSALKGPIHQIRDAAIVPVDSFPYLPSLSRNQDSDMCLKRLAGALFLSGHELQWSKVHSVPESVSGRTPVLTLPPYPWDHSGRLLWTEPRLSKELRNRLYRRHELLGTRQLATNGVDHSWRNVLNIDELFWLRDHKVEEQIVFPAACYLALATEALSQIRELRSGTDHGQFAFKFSNVSINAALILPDQNSAKLDNVEVHTTMSPRRLSTRTTSSEIYDFQISSWTARTSTVHCVGSIRLINGTLPAKEKMTDGIVGFKPWSLGPWYDKAREEGLAFGPHFQSLVELRTDKYQSRSEVEGVTEVEPSCSKRSATYYAIHPVTIDACLQAVMLSAASGKIHDLRPYLPVFLSECCFQPIDPADRNGNGLVYARAEKTGFTSLRADCDFYSSNDTLALCFKDLRFSMYTELSARVKENNKTEMQRNPMFQITWKPDITRLYPGMEHCFNDHVNTLMQEDRFGIFDDGVPVTVAALLDLFGHQNPRMRLFHFGDSYAQEDERWLDVLNRNTAFPRYRSWQASAIGEDEIPEEAGRFDVLLCLDEFSMTEWEAFSRQLPSLIGDKGSVIALRSDDALTNLNDAGFDTIIVQEEILLAFPKRNKPSAEKQVIVIIHHNPSALVTQLTTRLQEELKRILGVVEIHETSLLDLDPEKIGSSTLCISLVEVEQKLLATMTGEEMDAMRVITENTTKLLWLSGANMMNEPNPDLSLVNGLARSLMAENPWLSFTIMDIGPVAHAPEQVVCSLISDILLDSYGAASNDKDLILSNGVLHIPRFDVNFQANSKFRRLMKIENQIQHRKISEVQHARLSIGDAGLMDTLHFQEVDAPHGGPPPGFLDVAVKAVSLNAKDVYAVNGIIDTQDGTLAHEFGGVVLSAGTDVDFKPGDRVLVARPTHFRTTERVPAWTARALLPDEDFGTVATLPVIYGSALHALRDCARLQAGESVLIHSGAGAFGIAAITIARNIGATVYATVGSSNRREFLKTELGVPDNHIFNSRDDSFVKGLKNATNGRGVDVVVNSLTGALMHASWGCVADFGRFVEIGKRELLDAGRLEMDVFSRNVTFVAFDLSDVFFSTNPAQRATYHRLMDDILEMYRSGQIKPVPITRFDVAEISKAYRYFSTQDRIGKIVISFEADGGSIPTALGKYTTVLNPDKVYLLVGCLGGLGRSLSGWMLARGARKFTFLGRSGADKDDAKELVGYLESVGARVVVVRGDVSNQADVNRAVAACTSDDQTLGGVVQAAMWPNEDLFSRMPVDRWHKCVQPKWAGTWNLHRALGSAEEKDLDFFLLFSSVAGSVGVPTESNYCAANAFLDAFAHFRRSQGKVATSVGFGSVSEVGYLHENPEIEALSLRRGIQPLDEEEFLQVVDLGFSSSNKTAQYSNAHIVAGLETNAVLNLLAQGFEVTNIIMDTAPASILASAFEVIKDLTRGRGSRSKRDDAAMPLEFRGLPKEIADILMAEVLDTASLRASVNEAISQRFSNLILLPVDKIQRQKSFAQYGVDSMIASEFRSWFWATFHVDVPFFDLLSPQKNIETITELVEFKLNEALETSLASRG